MPDSIVYTDSLSSYDKLDVSGFIHHRINHSKEFADRRNHINSIGNFLESGKTRLAQIQRNRSQIFPAVLERMRISV